MDETHTGTRPSLTRRLLPLAWALLVLVALIVLLVWQALRIQVALAGLMNGESIWSKAQKQAVIDLNSYATRGDPKDLAGYRRNYAILTYDRFVRDGSKSDQVPYEALAEALGHGNALPESVPGVIFLLRHLTGAPYMTEVLKLWRSTDKPLEELNEVAAQLQHSYAQGKPDTAEIVRQREKIRRLNAYIEPRSNRFSEQTARGVVWVSRVLFGVVSGVALFVVLLWLFMARSILAGIRGTEERYRLLFDSAADGIVMIDVADDRILEANRQACQWSGHEASELQGMPIARLFMPDGSTHSPRDHYRLMKQADGSLLPVEIQSSNVVWAGHTVKQAIIRDVSERLAMRQAQRIASEAMANIAEGVIIVDVNRQVLSVNVAYTRMTGADIKSLQGSRLEDSRRMPDGQPLPEEVWNTILREGNWLGEVNSERTDGSIYSELLSISAIRDGNGQIQNYVGVITDVSGAKADRRRLEHLARHDTLTNLLNRAEFVRQCDKAILAASGNHQVVALLFVDLNNFKIVNDSYSHATGDQLLVRVAERIRDELSPRDVAGRIGGDEFTVLATGLEEREEVEDLAGRLTASLSKPMEVEGQVVTLGASIGIAAWPLDGLDAVALIASADAAMYAAKMEQRNTHRYYTPLMQADAKRRLKMVDDLRKALKHDELRLVYQPSVMMNTGRVAGVEALLRWDHPQRGEIMPAEFVPLAEEVGLARDIDEWVLTRVCAQIKAWEMGGMTKARVAVNISAIWFGHQEFMQVLHKVLDEYRISPSSLVIEIVESTSLHLGGRSVDNMRALHDLGIGVAIDDFGTGYSTLSYLKLPSVNYLKVDKSFVAGLPGNTDDAEIVRATLAISLNLGLTAIAEGVETQEQHDFLLALGCQEAQGFFYARPLPADRIPALMGFQAKSSVSS
ncbi:MAG: EAL domain-containing protein [Rhodanobacteraceae bacterium]